MMATSPLWIGLSFIILTMESAIGDVELNSTMGESGIDRIAPVNESQTPSQISTGDTTDSADGLNGEAPVADQAAPVADQTAPVADQTAPVADQTAPVADQTAPVADQTAPVADQTAPVADQTAPVADQTAPVADQTAPVADQAAPVTDQVAPVTDQAAPVADQTAPVAENVGTHKHTANGQLKGKGDNLEVEAPAILKEGTADDKDTKNNLEVEAPAVANSNEGTADNNLEGEAPLAADDKDGTANDNLSDESHKTDEIDNSSNKFLVCFFLFVVTASTIYLVRQNRKKVQ